MQDEEDLQELTTVTYGRTPLSPPPGAAGTLKLTLEAGNGDGKPPLLLHGFYSLPVDRTGRYSASMPSPIRVVAMARKAAHVYFSTLTRQDDIPAQYLGVGAPPAVYAKGPNGPVSKGISQSGFFTVDIKPHLGLADAADIYDVFLWLEEYASEVVPAEKPATPGESPGNAADRRSPAIAKTGEAPAVEAPSISAQTLDGVSAIHGTSGAKVALVAYCLESNRQGHVVLPVREGAGIEFTVKLGDLVPDLTSGEKVFTFALANGKRSNLLETVV